MLILRSGLVLLMALTACRSIPRADPNAKRQELEVQVVMAESFRRHLTEADATLTELVESVVLHRADIGLRFYAIASSRYAEEHTRPEFLLTITLRNLAYSSAPAQDRSTADMTRFCVGVDTTLERRRAGAPPLAVARSLGKGTTVNREPAYRGRPMEASYTVVDASDHIVSVGSGVIRAALSEAVVNSLIEMLPAIDRELAH